MSEEQSVTPPSRSERGLAARALGWVQRRPAKIAHYARLARLHSRWRRSPQRRNSEARLRELRDQYRGQRCFVIGNGPSLNNTDLSLLRDERTFGMNRIYLLFEELGFPTTFLVSINQLVLEQCASEIAALPMTKFVSWRGLHTPLATSDAVFLRSSHQAGFSYEPFKVVYESATVTNICLQLAYYLGFSQAILIGVDHNFSTKGKPNKAVVSTGDDPNHFSGAYFGKGFKWNLPDLVQSEVGYHAAREAFAQDGREVVDATVGGKLTVFPKVRYEDLF